MKGLNIFILLLITILCSCTEGKKQETIVPPVVDTVVRIAEVVKQIDTSNQVFHINQTDSITIGYLKNGETCGDWAIYYNENLILCDTSNEFIYHSKYNRVIKDDGHILLFVETDGRPNFNHIVGYEISRNTAKIGSDCVYNDENQRHGTPPFTDMDNDGLLEIGGFDLTEIHKDPDSIYYIPSKFYEIKDGTVKFDSVLTKNMDIKVNGIYQKKGVITILKPKR